MKTSWIIFIAMIYAAIFYFSGVAEYTNNLDSSVMLRMQNLGQPTGTNFGVGLTSQIVLVWDYMVNFIKMVFLWNPTLWSGSWYYFYVFVCLPVCIGVVFSIVTIMRGVHSD
jgi:hypothetical protein